MCKRLLLCLALFGAYSCSELSAKPCESDEQCDNPAGYRCISGRCTQGSSTSDAQAQERAENPSPRDFPPQERVQPHEQPQEQQVPNESPPDTCPKERSCAGQCVDLTSDPKHCGACTRPCPATSVCQASTCTPCSDQPPAWQWAIKVGGNNSDTGYVIAIDKQKNAIFAGEFQETATFGRTSLTSAGDKDIFVAKIDSSGRWLWATKAGGTSVDTGYGMVLDGQGNTIITGYFNGTANFGNISLTSAGGNDVFVAKINSSGKWLWAIKAGGNGLDSGRAVVLDGQGNLTIIGDFSSSAVNFGGTTLTSAGGFDIFVARVDSSGKWLWAIKAGSPNPGFETAVSLSLDGQGNAIITGYFNDTTTFVQRTTGFGDLTLTSAGGWEVFVAKVDNSGKWLWATKAGGVGDDLGRALTLDGQGNAIITGWFTKTATFGSISLTSAGKEDIFVAKVDSSGKWLWATKVGGNESDSGRGLTSDGQGNAIITGYFREAAAFGGNSLTSTGEYDVFVAKVDGAGKWLWATKVGGSSSGSGIALALDGQGDAIITGDFSGTATFGSTTLTSAGEHDVFVAKVMTANRLICDNLCVNPMNDPKHCGGCANACAGNQTCQLGICK